MKIAQLSAERQALVDALLADLDTADPRPGAIPERSRGMPLPLSFAEERVWLLDRFQPASPSHHLHLALNLDGDLSIAALRAAACRVLERHEILRTRYPRADSGPVRTIDQTSNVELPLRDLSELPEVRRNLEMEKLLREQAGGAFDLAKGPLVRFLLLRLGKRSHVLTATMHQIVADGPSLRILVSEMLAGHASIRRGEPVCLPDVSIQYADFAAWQRSAAQVAASSEHLSYWRSQRLAEVPELRLRGASADRQAWVSRSSISSQVLDEARLTACKRLANEHGTTLFTVLLASFQALLFQYAGQLDFLLGVMVANRSRPETQGLIGPFANLLPMRARMSGGPDLAEVLERARKTVIEAFSHQEVPCEHIAEQTHPPRLTVAVVFHEPMSGGTESSLKISVVPSATGYSVYDLRLSFLETSTALVASLEFRDDLLSEEDAKQMLGDLDHILAAATTKPNLSVSELPARAITGVITPAVNDAAASEAAPAALPTQRSVTKRLPGDQQPRNSLERELAKLWEAVLDIHPIGIRDDFFASGGTSLAALRLFALIEQSFGKRLPLSVLLEAPTIEKLAKVLGEEGFSRRWQCLVPIQPAGFEPPFFCVHGAAGNVLFLRGLARHLGGNRPLYGFQSAGLDGNTTPLTSVEGMAGLYLAELRTVQPRGPYYLGGFCFGIYVAIEMARQLQREGERVALLAAFNETGAWRMVNSFQDAVDLHGNTLARLSARAKLAYLGDRLVYRTIRVAAVLIASALRLRSWAGGSPSASLAPLRIEKANHAAGLRYWPKPYSGRFVLFRSETVAETRGSRFWESIVEEGIESHVLPGRENALFDEPVVEELAAKLTGCLERGRPGLEARPVTAT